LFLLRKNHKNEEELLNQLKISSTYLETNGIMHLQDRNVHGKIFGGYLMREML
jgi:acyl-CoA hydrolase